MPRSPYSFLLSFPGSPATRLPGSILLAVSLALCLSVSILAQVPPTDPLATSRVDLVEIVAMDPSVWLDMKYARPDNFTGRVMYSSACAFLQRPAAEALLRAGRKLHALGYGIVVWDAYRPWHVTKLFWDVTPPKKRMFVATPIEGSRHNRGCAVDVTLYDLRTGREVEMPSGFDDFSERAHPDYRGGTPESRRLRDLLRRTMQAEGFTVYDNEWWHYDYRGWRNYPILDIDFSEVGIRGYP